MSRFGRDPRRSSGDLAYGDFNDCESSSAGGRWDPERFTRERERAARARAPALIERDRYEEHDYYEPPRESRAGFGGRRRENSADGFYGGETRRPSGRTAPFRFEEREREGFVFKERPKESFGPPARRRESGRYYDEEIDTFDGSAASGPITPFDRRRQSINKDFVPSPRRAPPRPGIIRRQSSLDTFDRKPLPRYGDRFREPPETIVIPTSAKRRSPPRYPERDFEDHRASFAHEEFRGYREREISRVRRDRADASAEFVEHESFEIEEDEIEKPYPRKGKTKMPAKLVNKRAIIELGYPFEQEGETIIILKALAKEHIDEIIKISKEMNERGESRTTYVIEAPPPPQPEVIERRTEIIVSPPPPPNIPPSIRDWDDGHSTIKAGKSSHGGKSTHGGKSSHGGHSTHGGHSRSHSHHGGHSKHHSRSSSSSSSSSSPPSELEIIRPSRSRHRSRSNAASRKEVIIEEVGVSNAIGSVPEMQLVVPHRSKSTHRDERSIKAEIRALEAEKKALKYEREIEKEEKKAQRYRDRDGDVIIERVKDRGETVKIEKDKKAQDSKLLRGMLATLT